MGIIRASNIMRRLVTAAFVNAKYGLALLGLFKEHVRSGDHMRVLCVLNVTLLWRAGGRAGNEGRGQLGSGSDERRDA